MICYLRTLWDIDVCELCLQKQHRAEGNDCALSLLTPGRGDTHALSQQQEATTMTLCC